MMYVIFSDLDLIKIRICQLIDAVNLMIRILSNRILTGDKLITFCYKSCTMFLSSNNKQITKMKFVVSSILAALAVASGPRGYGK